jgi:putative ABC transport system substrate-binding protein
LITPPLAYRLHPAAPAASLTRLNCLLLCLALFFLIPAAACAQPKQVVFIRYRIVPNHFNTVVQEFRATMAKRGYLDGKDIEYVDVLTRSDDHDSVPDIIDAVKKYKNSADMFITCGWVSMEARRLLAGSGVPQLFAPVLDSVALEMLPSLKRPPDTNLSGLYLMYPPEKILRLARLIIPKLRDYAYVYDSRIPADMVFKRAYERLDEPGRHGLNLHYLDLAAGVEKVLAKLRSHQIGAYGGIVGSFKNRQALSASNIPVITSFTLDINQQAIAQYTANDTTVAGLFNPFQYCGAQAAEITADIFDNKRTIEDTVPRPAMQVAFINLINATRLHLPVSFDALEAVDLVIK